MPISAHAELPVVWRTKLRSTIPGVDWTAQVQRCLDERLIGIGWRIDDLPPEPSLDTVCDWIESRQWDGWGRRAAQTVRRFGQAAQVGDFVWTRDTAGRYLLCRIAGGYRYDGSAVAASVDVHQVRDVEWAPRPLGDLEVPGGVIRGFMGTGSSFSRIRDERARLLTSHLWEVLHEREGLDLGLTRRDVLDTILDPYDVEDLVYVWLQVARGYLALPRARNRDTPAYEWTMIHRQTRRRAILQIKTGSVAVDLTALHAACVDEQTDTFAFATSGQYHGDRASVTEVIDPDDLLALVAREPDLLAERTRSMFDLASS